MNTNIPVSHNDDGVYTGGMLHGNLEDEITCDCNDRSCEKKGIEGEVANHIENCSCAICHRYMGKISPWLKHK